LVAAGHAQTFFAGKIRGHKSITSREHRRNSTQRRQEAKIYDAQKVQSKTELYTG